MDNRPIGVFDSGVGGLTALREIKALLPNENIVYFGDTGRLPYGSKSRDTIIRFSQQIIHFLLSKDVKLLVAACGTISSTLPASIYENLPVHYLGVVEPTIQAACKLSQNGRIGVIATKTTIRNNSYGNAIRSVRPDAQIFSCACPLLVPIVEDNHLSPDDPIAQMIVRHYLDQLRPAGIDTLILGCTHYPMLYDAINQTLDYSVALVDPGREVARSVQSFLTEHNMLTAREEPGQCQYYMSDSAEDFCSVASIFLANDIGKNAQQIDITDSEGNGSK